MRLLNPTTIRTQITLATQMLEVTTATKQMMAPALLELHRMGDHLPKNGARFWTEAHRCYHFFQENLLTPISMLAQVPTYGVEASRIAAEWSGLQEDVDLCVDQVAAQMRNGVHLAWTGTRVELSMVRGVILMALSAKDQYREKLSREMGWTVSRTHEAVNHLLAEGLVVGDNSRKSLFAGGFRSRVEPLILTEAGERVANIARESLRFYFSRTGLAAVVEKQVSPDEGPCNADYNIGNVLTLAAVNQGALTPIQILDRLEQESWAPVNYSTNFRRVQQLVESRHLAVAKEKALHMGKPRDRYAITKRGEQYLHQAIGALRPFIR